MPKLKRFDRLNVLITQNTINNWLGFTGNENKEGRSLMAKQEWFTTKAAAPLLGGKRTDTRNPLD